MQTFNICIFMEMYHVLALLRNSVQLSLFVLHIHAQDPQQPLTTRRRTWQKSASSVRRIYSTPSSTPVTPSAEVRPHSDWVTHAVFQQYGSLMINFNLSLNSIAACFSSQRAEVIPSAPDSHTVSALSVSFLLCLLAFAAQSLPFIPAPFKFLISSLCFLNISKLLLKAYLCRGMGYAFFKEVQRTW